MSSPFLGATLDVLPLKRVLALEESGNELLPVEPTPEEKPLALLSRIDFGQTNEKDAKKAKTGKEVASAPGAWPWQGVVENLQQAHEELNIILDLITQVEANDAITVVSMMKPKFLPHEGLNDLALRASSKVSKFRDVGKYFKRTAQALEAQVEREAVFFGALMRLQRNWKVKRQRGVAAGPGESAGFSIDLSFPLPADVSSLTSGRASGLSMVNLDQDLSGLLQAHKAVGRQLNKLCLTLETTRSGHQSWERQDVHNDDISSAMEEANRKSESSEQRGIGQGVDTGAKGAQAVLRNIQGAMYHELVFEWVGREAVLPNSGMNVIGIRDMCLQFSLSHAASLTLELARSDSSKKVFEAGDDYGSNERKEEESRAKWNTVQRPPIGQMFEKSTYETSSPRFSLQKTVSSNSSLVVCLHQAFHQNVFGFPIELDPGLVTFKLGARNNADVETPKPKESATTAATFPPGKEAANSDVASSIRHFSAIMSHRVLSNRVLSELEMQVSQVPSFQLLTHPTWHPRVSAWDLSFATPMCTSQKDSECTTGSQEVRFQCTIVLRDELLTVEGLTGESRFAAPANVSLRESLPLSKQNIDLSELRTFLLFQVASSIVLWLHEESLAMGLNVSRDLLSLVFQLEGCDDIALVACPEAKALCINWWLRIWSPAMEDSSQKNDAGSYDGHAQQCLGALSLDSLRRLVLDLINLECNLEAGVFD